MSALAGGLVWGCARAAPPPGGPPDLIPPFVVETVPDTFARVPDYRGPVILRFSKRISERPSRGSWNEAVVVSPESGAVRVRVRRDALEIRPEGGILPGRVYRVSLAPVVRDLFQNTLMDPFELVFSTGPDFEPGVLAGLVWDRVTGEPLPDHRVEAVAVGDTVRHLARSDSAGIFALRYLPAGSYEVTAWLDRNRNRRLDETEPRGRVETPLAGDTVVVTIPVLTPDTTPARVTRVELQDSVTIRVSFDDPLDPDRPLDDVRWRLIRLSDSTEVPIVRGIFHRAGLEEILRRDREAEGLPPEEAAPPRPGLPPGRTVRTTTPDGRPLPARELFLLLSLPLAAGEPHRVEVEGVVNLHGVPGGGGEGTVERAAPTPARTPPPDTLSDTLRGTVVRGERGAPPRASSGPVRGPTRLR